jgi:hypothetical protein
VPLVQAFHGLIEILHPHPGESEPGKPNIHRRDPGAGAASLSGTQ